MPDEYIQDVFLVNRWILRCAGLWSPANSSKFVQIPYKIYAVSVFLFVNVYFTSTEFFSLFWTYKNLSDFIKNVNFFLTHFMGAVKVTFWFFKGHVLRKLMAILESGEFHYSTCPSHDYYPGEVWRKYRKIGITYSLGFLLLAHMTLSSSYMPPLITVAFDPPQGNGSIEFYTRLPYFSWMPFSHLTPATYLLALGYQAGPMFSYAYSIVGMDSLFMNIMNFIAAHFTVLQGAFMSGKQRVLENLSENVPSESVRNEINKELRKNCRHLQTVLRVCQDLENVHRFLTLGQATATLFILCTCLYLISTTPAGSKQFYAELVYMIAMGFQLYLYCWFGNEVTLLARDIPLYIWNSDWFDCDHSFKKTMIFTMTTMKKPIYMTVGKFAPLTLQTFVTIIKTSYSIFAVIKNTSL